VRERSDKRGGLPREWGRVPTFSEQSVVGAVFMTGGVRSGRAAQLGTAACDGERYQRLSLSLAGSV